MNKEERTKQIKRRVAITIILCSVVSAELINAKPKKDTIVNPLSTQQITPKVDHTKITPNTIPICKAQPQEEPKEQLESNVRKSENHARNEENQTKPTTTPPNLDIPLNNEYQQYIYEQCDYDDDLYLLIVAVIKTESNFDPYAVSYDGHDYGLMQLRDSYHAEMCENYGVSDPKEPYDNLKSGISMLKEYLDKWEYKNLALMCYNCGQDGARKMWKNGIYSTDYTVKVLNTYKQYKEEVTP